VPSNTDAATDVDLTEDIKKPKWAPNRIPVIIISFIRACARENSSWALSLIKKGTKRRVAKV
jgi:hypothetical protein